MRGDGRWVCPTARPGWVGRGGVRLGMRTGELTTLEVLGLLTVHSVLLGFGIGADAGSLQVCTPLSTHAHVHPPTGSTSFPSVHLPIHPPSTHPLTRLSIHLRMRTCPFVSPSSHLVVFILVLIRRPNH